MFNRRIARPVNPAVLEKNDITALQNLGTKTAEQRIVLRHEGYIKDLRNKVHENQQLMSKPSEEHAQNAKIETLREQCEVQSKMLKEYEEKLVGMVGYIKRLEDGLEKVKELLVNNTNTADTMDNAPELDEPSGEAGEEPVSVESVASEDAVDGDISLEITE